MQVKTIISILLTVVSIHTATAAMNFTAGNQQAANTSLTSLPGGSVSLLAWVYINGTASSVIGGYYIDATDDASIKIFQRNNGGSFTGQVACFTNQTVSNAGATTTNVPPKGWYAIRCSFVASTRVEITMWQISTSTQSGLSLWTSKNAATTDASLTAPASGFALGNEPSQSNAFNGSIYNFASFGSYITTSTAMQYFMSCRPILGGVVAPLQQFPLMDSLDKRNMVNPGKSLTLANSPTSFSNPIFSCPI